MYGELIIDQWKSRYAVKTKHRTLEDAVKGADVFLGLSAKGVLKEMVKSMQKIQLYLPVLILILKLLQRKLMKLEMMQLLQQGDQITSIK